MNTVWGSALQVAANPVQVMQTRLVSPLLPPSPHYSLPYPLLLPPSPRSQACLPSPKRTNRYCSEGPKHASRMNSCVHTLAPAPATSGTSAQLPPERVT